MAGCPGLAEPLSLSQGPVLMPWSGSGRQLPTCWRCSQIWIEPTRSFSSRNRERWPQVPCGPEDMPEPAWKEEEGAGLFSAYPGPEAPPGSPVPTDAVAWGLLEISLPHVP